MKDVTKDRIQAHGYMHKLGRGGVRALKATMWNCYQRLPSEEEIKFARKEGFVKLRNEKMEKSKNSDEKSDTLDSESTDPCLGQDATFEGGDTIGMEKGDDEAVQMRKSLSQDLNSNNCSS